MAVLRLAGGRVADCSQMRHLGHLKFLKFFQTERESRTDITCLTEDNEWIVGTVIHYLYFCCVSHLFTAVFCKKVIFKKCSQLLDYQGLVLF